MVLSKNRRLALALLLGVAGTWGMVEIASAQLLNQPRTQGQTQDQDPAPSGATAPPSRPQQEPVAPVEEEEDTFTSTGLMGYYEESTRVYENWSLQCVVNEGTQSCFIETRIRQNEPSPRDIVLIRMTRLAESGDLSMSVAVPNGVLIQANARMVVGEQSYDIPYQICGAQNCFATSIVASDLHGALTSSPDAEVVFTVPGPRNVRVPISLAGLPRALERLLEQ